LCLVRKAEKRNVKRRKLIDKQDGRGKRNSKDVTTPR